jgi:hypothetical protein
VGGQLTGVLAKHASVANNFPSASFPTVRSTVLKLISLFEVSRIYFLFITLAAL